METYLNPSLSPEERAEDLLSKLSLEEKIGQLSCVFAKDMESLPQVAPYLSNGIGQVGMLEMRTIETSEECAGRWNMARSISALAPLPKIFVWKTA